MYAFHGNFIIIQQGGKRERKEGKKESIPLLFQEECHPSIPHSGHNTTLAMFNFTSRNWWYTESHDPWMFLFSARATGGWGAEEADMNNTSRIMKCWRIGWIQLEAVMNLLGRIGRLQGGREGGGNRWRIWRTEIEEMYSTFQLNRYLFFRLTSSLSQ